MTERADPADVARSFLRFAAVGVVATALHIAVFALLVETSPVDPVAATAIAFGVAFVAGYLMNRRWTFRSTGAWTAELPRYLATQLAGLALNAAIMAIAVHALALSPYAGLAASLLLVPPLSYLLARRWAFASRGTDAQPPRPPIR